jgi:hypothetical protein
MLVVVVILCHRLQSAHFLHGWSPGVIGKASLVDDTGVLTARQGRIRPPPTEQSLASTTLFGFSMTIEQIHPPKIQRFGRILLVDANG